MELAASKTSVQLSRPKSGFADPGKGPVGNGPVPSALKTASPLNMPEPTVMAIWLPSRDQAGPDSSCSDLDSTVNPVPSAFRTQIRCGGAMLPSGWRRHVYARREPSGDHAGRVSSPAASVRFTTPVPSMFVRKTSAALPGLTNAIGCAPAPGTGVGGFQRLSFRDPDVGVEPITLDAAFAAELQRRTVLCYTGRSRMSGATIARVMAAYERGDPAVMDALQAMKDVAERMVEALRAANLARVAELLTENWRHQRSLDPEMRTPEMAQLEQAVTAAGALGGRAAGSGAGGCMFFLSGDQPAAVIAAARAAGVTLLPVRWAREGVRAW